jgi:hypothetical protein
MWLLRTQFQVFRQDKCLPQAPLVTLLAARLNLRIQNLVNVSTYLGVFGRNTTYPSPNFPASYTNGISWASTGQSSPSSVSPFMIPCI